MARTSERGHGQRSSRKEGDRGIAGWAVQFVRGAIVPSRLGLLFCTFCLFIYFLLCIIIELLKEFCLTQNLAQKYRAIFWVATISFQAFGSAKLFLEIEKDNFKCC